MTFDPERAHEDRPGVLPGQIPLPLDAAASDPHGAASERAETDSANAEERETMPAKTATIKDLAQNIEIASVERAPTDLERADDSRDRARGSYPADRGARYFTATLTYKGRKMETPFHMGSALTDDPDAATVIDCLISDADGIENAGSFEAWCDEYGYDTDSRRAERLYQQVKTLTERTRYLLGSDYERFRTAERL